MIPETVRHRVFRELGSSTEDVKLLGGYSDNVFEIEHTPGTHIVVKILDHTVTPRSILSRNWNGQAGGGLCLHFMKPLSKDTAVLIPVQPVWIELTTS